MSSKTKRYSILNDLLEKVNVGDSVKVYYRKGSEKGNINIDLIQVEKNEKILISKDEYEKKESALIYIGLTAGIGTLFMAYKFYRFGNKYKHSRRKSQGTTPQN